jgi:hypothetical protein
MATQEPGAAISRPRAEIDMRWVREQLRIADEILDNPGGGLAFGYQAIGQVWAHLAEADEDYYRDPIRVLREAERQAVWRNFGRARELIAEAGTKLDRS